MIADVVRLAVTGSAVQVPEMTVGRQLATAPGAARTATAVHATHHHGWAPLIQKALIQKALSCDDADVYPHLPRPQTALVQHQASGLTSGSQQPPWSI
jgi:hypothetical protein